MHTLNLPMYPIKTVQRSGKHFVFDIFRKRYVALTPEEWVRQHFLWWLKSDKGYPVSLIVVESSVKYNNLSKRADAIVYGSKSGPMMVIEFKSPAVAITRDVFDQVARYNFPLRVPYLVVTNGLTHYCCMRDEQSGQWLFLDGVPDYRDLVEGSRAV